MSEAKIKLGRLIRDARDAAGMSQEAVGRAAGYSKSPDVAISKLERGVQMMPPHQLDLICRAIGLDVGEAIALWAEHKWGPLSADATRAIVHEVIARYERSKGRDADPETVKATMDYLDDETCSRVAETARVYARVRQLEQEEKVKPRSGGTGRRRERR